MRVGWVEGWVEVKTKGFIEPKGSSAEREGKEGWAEVGCGKTRGFIKTKSL